MAVVVEAFARCKATMRQGSRSAISASPLVSAGVGNLYARSNMRGPA